MQKQANDKTVAEFFAGIGLVREGLNLAGWKTNFANDIDPSKQSIYINHFGDSDNHFLLEDIHNLTAEQVPTVSLATASFPCTDLSLAGRRAGLDGKNSSAFWGFIKILKGLDKRKPPLVLLENVAGFLSSNKGQDFHDALSALNELGYDVDAFILDAVHFVPQSRVRMFIVGKLNDKQDSRAQVNLLESELRPKKLVQFINQHPEIHWDINNHLPKLPAVQNEFSKLVEKVKKDSPLWFSQDRVEYLLNQTFDRHRSKLEELKAGKTYSYVTAFRRVRNGKSMAEIRFDGVAGCLRTPKGGSARQILLEAGKGEINVRLVTPLECARLMGADNFKISGSVNEALYGFGDAVCVPAITWIAEHYLNPEMEKLKDKTQQKRSYAIA